MTRRKAKTPRDSYALVGIGEAAGPEVEQFVRNQLEMYLRDIHTMLRLPRPQYGLHAGCNFAIAHSTHRDQPVQAIVITRTTAS